MVFEEFFENNEYIMGNNLNLFIMDEMYIRIFIFNNNLYAFVRPGYSFLHTFTIYTIKITNREINITNHLTIIEDNNNFYDVTENKLYNQNKLTSISKLSELIDKYY